MCCFFKQKTAYELRISDWRSDVCSSDLLFHPDRLAGRILGMGDILSLIEKAESVYEEAEAEVAAQKLMEGQFTFDDFLDQMAQIKKMGSISDRKSVV